MTNTFENYCDALTLDESPSISDPVIRYSRERGYTLESGNHSADSNQVTVRFGSSEPWAIAPRSPIIEDFKLISDMVNERLKYCCL